MVNAEIKAHVDKLLIVLAVSLILVGLVQLRGRRAPAAEEAPQDIVFVHFWEDILGAEILEELIGDFQTLTGLRVEVQSRSYEELLTGLFSLSPASPEGETLGEESPFLGDIFGLDSLWVPDLVAGGLIDGPWTLGLGEPLLSFINVFYYNIELLSQGGFINPPKTRSELISQARRLKELGLGSPILIDQRNPSFLHEDIFPWIWAAGGRLFQDERPLAASRQVQEGLGFLAALKQEGLMGSGGGKAEEFMARRGAFMIAPARYIDQVRARLGEDAFSVSTLPVPDTYNGWSYYNSTGWTLGIAAASSQREEVINFGNFLAQRLPLYAEQVRAMPNTNTPLFNQDPHYSKVWDIFISSGETRDFEGLPWIEIEGIFREELQALLERASIEDPEYDLTREAASISSEIQRRWTALLE